MPHEIVSSAPGSPEPADLFEPHMPGVDVLADMDALFADAREKTAGIADGDPGVAIVTPGRSIMMIPMPAPGSMPEQQAAAMRDFVGGDRPVDAAAVSYTRLDALLADETMTKCIPFLGHLIRLAYVGSRVVVFEGHPTAFEAGVRGTDLLFVDSGMLPFLQEDWAAVAFRAMRPGGRVFIHGREQHSLNQIAPKSTAPGWRYAEPDGEASYVNCLLTTLAKSPAPRPVRIVSGAALPDLAPLNTTAEDLDWVASLPFRYDRLSADQAMSILEGYAKKRKIGLFRSELVIQTKLATDGGAKMTDVSFRVTPGKDGGRRSVDVERI